MRITFKTDKPTGKWSGFQEPTHYIKINKKVVGSIESKKPFRIWLMVIKKDILEDGNPNCGWKWITLAQKHESVQSAKEWFIENIELINAKFNLYLHPDL